MGNQSTTVMAIGSDLMPSVLERKVYNTYDKLSTSKC